MSHHRDSNPGPLLYESNALASVLWWQMLKICLLKWSKIGYQPPPVVAWVEQDEIKVKYTLGLVSFTLRAKYPLLDEWEVPCIGSSRLQGHARGHQRQGPAVCGEQEQWVCESCAFLWNPSEYMPGVNHRWIVKRCIDGVFSDEETPATWKRCLSLYLEWQLTALSLTESNKAWITERLKNHADQEVRSPARTPGQVFWALWENRKRWALITSLYSWSRFHPWSFNRFDSRSSASASLAVLKRYVTYFISLESSAGHLVKQTHWTSFLPCFLTVTVLSRTTFNQIDPRAFSPRTSSWFLSEGNFFTCTIPLPMDSNFLSFRKNSLILQGIEREK